MPDSEPARPPLVTVVTIVKDDVDGLRATLASVREQTYPRLEHVVIDGGSTDGTAEVVAEHADALAHWVSEPDGGISEAFNKGLAAARGDWVNFLNAADTFEAPDSVARAAAHFADAHVVTGFARFGASRLPPRPLANDEPLERRALISHQASFVRRAVFDECGGFDESYRVRMDYELWLRVLARYEFVFLETRLVRYDLTGQSGRMARLFRNEEYAANRKHLADWRRVNARAWTWHTWDRFLWVSGLRRAWRRMRRSLRGS